MDCQLELNTLQLLIKVGRSCIQLILVISAFAISIFQFYGIHQSTLLHSHTQQS